MDNEFERRLGCVKAVTKSCYECHSALRPDFARCPCGTLREAFKGTASIVALEPGHCVLSGALTDVRLLNGDYIYAPYFLEYRDKGWIGEDLAYTPAFYEQRAPIRKR